MAMVRLVPVLRPSHVSHLVRQARAGHGTMGVLWVSDDGPFVVGSLTTAPHPFLGVDSKIY